MKIRAGKFQSLAFVLLIATSGFGQGSSFRLAMNNNIFKGGDTIELEAVYAIGEKKLPPATLDIIVENEKGNTWNIRWPLIEGKAAGSIVLSSLIPNGKYNFWFAIQPRFFRIYGQMLYCSRKKVKNLLASIFTSVTPISPQQLKLDPDGSFLIEDWMLTNEIRLSFSTGDAEDVLHIHPECWLDSAYNPAAKAYVAVHLSDTDTLIKEKSSTPDFRPVAWSGTGAYKYLSPAETFNHFFSKGRFRDTSEFVVDVMNDPTVKPGIDIADYIARRLLEKDSLIENRNGKLFYNGRELILFYNETPVRIPLSQMLSENFAIVKFFKSYVPRGDDSNPYVLAIYGKRYPFTDAGIAQNSFLIKGYDTETVVLK